MTNGELANKDEICMCGTVKKKSPKSFLGVNSWQNRYFILTNSSLKYFNSEKSSQIDFNVKGIIPTSKITALDTHDVDITRIDIVIGKRERIFSLKANSPEDAVKWKKKLELVIQYQHELKLQYVKDHIGLQDKKTQDQKFWKPSFQRKVSKGYGPSNGKVGTRGRRESTITLENSRRQHGSLEKSNRDLSMIMHALISEIRPPIGNCSKHERQELAKQFWRTSLEKDETLIGYQELCTSLMYIQQGTIGFRIPESRQEDLKLYGMDYTAPPDFNSGDIFNVSCLLQSFRSKHEYYATVDTVVWEIDATTFRELIEGWKTKDKNEIVTFLRQTDLLGGSKFTEAELLRIHERFQKANYRKGQVVLTEGSEGDLFYLIRKGSVRVTIKGEEVAILKEGDYFGERAVMNGAKRAATITAIGPVLILFMKAKSFQMELKSGVKSMVNESIKSYHVKGDKEFNDDDESDHKKKGLLKGWTSKDVKVLGVIGRGGFSLVRLVELNHKTYAMKSMNKAFLAKMDQCDHIKAELKLLNKMKHCHLPAINRIVGSCNEEDYVHILTEPILGGDFYTLLRDNKSLDDKSARFYVASVVLTLKKIHHFRYIHRDVRTENLMIDSKGYAVLIDFGFSKLIPAGERTYTVCGVPEYLAPEFISAQGHKFGIDWWALGILIFEILTGVTPFYNDDVHRMYEQIIAGKVKFPLHMSHGAKMIVKHLLKVKPSHRWGMHKGGISEILECEWYEDFDWSEFKHGKMKAPFPIKVENSHDIKNFESYPDAELESDQYTGNPKNEHWFADF